MCCDYSLDGLITGVYYCFCAISRKSGELTTQHFDKSLESFYAICDQIEINLVSARYCKISGNVQLVMFN